LELSEQGGLGHEAVDENCETLPKAMNRQKCKTHSTLSTGWQASLARHGLDIASLTMLVQMPKNVWLRLWTIDNGFKAIFYIDARSV
jgi:hypothetical protein